MKQVRLLAQAADELEHAVLWYEQESPQLGQRMLSAFEEALQLLKEIHPPLVPASGQAGALGAKRLLLHKFPFSIVVIEHENEFIVIALAHHSKRPNYWKDRLG